MRRSAGTDPGEPTFGDAALTSSEALLGCAPLCIQTGGTTVTKAEFIDRIAGDERIDSKKAASDAVEAVLDGDRRRR